MALAVTAGEKSKSGRNKKAGKKAEQAEKAAAAAALHEPERCARCYAIMIETHCKVICTNCGFMRDCNDQW